MTRGVDQKAQRDDPASTHAEFPDERASAETKQPDALPTGPSEEVETEKYNKRDDGHSHPVDDTPLRDIREKRGIDPS